MLFTSIELETQKSTLNKINSDFKMILAVIIIFCILAFSSNYVSAFAIISTMFLTVFVGKIKFKTYFKLLTIPLSFIIISGIVLLFEFSKSKIGFINIPVFENFISITNTSLAKTMLISLKAVASINVLYALCLSTPIFDIISSLKKVKVPKVVIELMFLIYRYIFVLAEIVSQMRISANLRMGFAGTKTTIKTTGLIMINLFILSFKKISLNFDAMEARCYEGDLCFLYNENDLHKKHLFIGIFYVLILIMIKVIERMFIA